MLRVIHRLARYKQNLGELREAQVQMFELMPEHELCLPLSMMTINLHSLVHLVHSILLAEPFPFWWMFPMERENFRFRKSLCSFKNPEETIVRSYVVREFSDFFGIVAGYHAVASFKRRAMKIKLKLSLRISPTNLALSFLEPVQLFFRHLLLSAVIICGSRLVLRPLAVRALPSGVRSIGC